MARYKSNQEILAELERRGKDVSMEALVAAKNSVDLHGDLDDTALAELIEALGLGQSKDLEAAVRETKRRSRDPVVVKYVKTRRRRLFGSPEPPLADMDEARRWIYAELEQMRPRTLYGRAQTGVTVLKGIGSTLAWPGESGTIEWCVVESDSPLADLALCSRYLVQKLGCEPGPATAYFLTGHVPVAEPIVTHLDVNNLTVTLKVNYPWVPARLVKEAYVRAVRQIDPARKRSRPAPRRARKP